MIKIEITYLHNFFFFFQNCNSDKYEIVGSSAMKNIYDSIKTIQNKTPVYHYKSFEIDEDFDDYYDDYDYSDDEGTTAPLNAKPFTDTPTIQLNTSKTQLEEPYTKLLSGFTNEDIEINVNNSNVY